MKTKIIFLMILSLSAINCKQTVKEDTKSADTNITKSALGSGQQLSTDWEEEMVLNNGTKWEANPETNTGIATMSKLVAETKTHYMEDYRNLGNALNEVKNSIVKECTMTGASHDNLHVFLHPLIQKIELLQKTDNTDAAAKIKESINGHLKSYYTYFD